MERKTIWYLFMDSWTKYIFLTIIFSSLYYCVTLKMTLIHNNIKKKKQVATLKYLANGTFNWIDQINWHNGNTTEFKY